jgi:hypothetical protein
VYTHAAKEFAETEFVQVFAIIVAINAFTRDLPIAHTP